MSVSRSIVSFLRGFNWFLTSIYISKSYDLRMPGHMYGATPRTTEMEPETEPETDTDTETENGNGNGTFNIGDFGLSTRIRSFVRVIFFVCLSIYFLDIWRFLYLPTYLFINFQFNQF